MCPMGRRDSLLDEIERDLLDGKPTSDLLRKCVVLGGRAGSTELRDWASQELKGYPDHDQDELPHYRIVPAIIRLNGVTRTHQITGQRIRPGALPDFTHDHIGEEVALYSGVGELEGLGARNSEIKFSLPMAADLAAYMNTESDDFQQITDLYWSVSSSAIAGVIDQIRTALAELVSEMRAALPAGQTEPGAQEAQQAVNVVVKGFGRAHVNQVQSAGGGDASVTTTGAVSEKPGLLTRVPKAVWGFLVGAATIGATVLAYLTYTK